MAYIKIKIPDEYGMFLKILLAGIGDDRTKWIVSDADDGTEVLDKNSNSLFKKDEYSNNEFYHLISSNDYYLIFLNLLKKDKEENIDLTLKVIDSTIVEVNTDNYCYINQIRENCKKYDIPISDI